MNVEEIPRKKTLMETATVQRKRRSSECTIAVSVASVGTAVRSDTSDDTANINRIMMILE